MLNLTVMVRESRAAKASNTASVPCLTTAQALGELKAARYTGKAVIDFAEGEPKVLDVPNVVRITLTRWPPYGKIEDNL